MLLSSLQGKINYVISLLLHSACIFFIFFFLSPLSVGERVNKIDDDENINLKK